MTENLESKQNIEEVVEKTEEDINYLQRALALIGGISVASFLLGGLDNTTPPEITNSMLLDHDGDHLSDEFEIRYGLDAQNADTDGDGISDFYEAFTFDQFVKVNQHYYSGYPDEEEYVKDADLNDDNLWTVKVIDSGYTKEGLGEIIIAENQEVSGEILEKHLQVLIVTEEDINNIFGEEFDWEIKSDAPALNPDNSNNNGFEDGIFQITPMTDEERENIQSAIENLFIGTTLPSGYQGPTINNPSKGSVNDIVVSTRLAQIFDTNGDGKWDFAE